MEIIFQWFQETKSHFLVTMMDCTPIFGSISLSTDLSMHSDFFLLCAKKSVPHNWKYFERKLSSHEWSKGTSMCSCAKASKFSFYVSSSFDTCHQTHSNFSLVHQMYYLLNSNAVYFLCKNITDLLMLIKTFQNFEKKKQSKLQNN